MEPMEPLEPQQVSITGEPRRYKITSVVGRGGFGTVYRARMEGNEGFHKDVALKILRDAEPSAEVLARFRDEARILGLVRDPHVVSVDPPVRLGGRWAIVMEYVDGMSCDELLRITTFPPSVALEIVEVISRTLDNLWTAVDGEGKPLRLVHRDLKPSNIQVTPNGHVKLLDFGVARAEFESRESHTLQHIGGTPGYMAPERLEGQDSHEGDVFSLGVVLHQLVTRSRPVIGAEIPNDLLEDPSIGPSVALALRMRAPDPGARPTAREVAELCRSLRSVGAPVELASWARQHAVPSQRPSDDLVGRTLSETASFLGPRPRPAAPVPILWLGLIAASVTGLVIGGGAVFGLGSLWLASLGPSSSERPPEEGRIEQIAPDPPPAPDPAPIAQPIAPPAPSEPAPAPSLPPPKRPPKVAPQGAVAVEGEAGQVELLCGGISFSAGKVPAGTCEVRASFGDGMMVPAGRVSVPEGGTVTLHCLAAFQRCKVR